MSVHTDACHCGAVTYEVRAEISDFYRCDCSLCARRGAVMSRVANDALVILAGADKLTLYPWNTHIARRYFCSVCGVYPFHRQRSSPDHTAINVLCLDGLDIAGRPVGQAHGATMSAVEGQT